MFRVTMVKRGMFSVSPNLSPAGVADWCRKASGSIYRIERVSA